MAQVPFHGEFTSADASALSEANSRFTLYKTPAGTRATITLGPQDQVVITDVDIVVGGTGLTITLYDGDNNTVAAGERILLGTFAANGGLSAHLQTPHYCLTQSYPKLKASAAGQVDATIRGFVVTNG